MVSSQKGNKNQIGKTLRDDPGGKARRDSDRALKTYERSVAGNMPLLSEFTNYSEWGEDARRRATMLRNLPISMGPITSLIIGRWAKLRFLIRMRSVS